MKKWQILNEKRKYFLGFDSMDNRKKNMDIINDRLSYLQFKITNANSLNLTDINIHAEDFFREFFTLLGYSFKSANYHTPNCPYFDLIDDENTKAIQVTAQNNNKKIEDSIKGFFGNPKYKNYNLKILLISKNAKDYKADFTDGGKYNFDHTKDVIDIQKLLADIKNKSLDEITKIATFLDKQILQPRQKTERNEVETIMALLEYISDDKHYKDFDKDYECDPYKKINSRFKEYANSFKEEFQDLYPIYCMSTLEAKNSFGFDDVRIEKNSCFLKRMSNQYLEEENNNPQAALNKLTDFFEEKVSKNGIKADICAIRYYLLDELIGCNIFSQELE